MLVACSVGCGGGSKGGAGPGGVANDAGTGDFGKVLGSDFEAVETGAISTAGL